MTDLISRSEVLDCARKVVSYNSAHLDINEIYVVDVEDIECAPAIDAVPVVRCNRCKYYEQDTGFCQYFGTGNSWDGFCNKGARMDEKEND